MLRNKDYKFFLKEKNPISNSFISKQMHYTDQMTEITLYVRIDSKLSYNIGTIEL